jgi:uncharacterized protein YndB with AHSA1/START domain
MEGTVREVDGLHEIRYERRLNHPIEKVWAAITQPAGLIGWLAEAEVELALGGRVQLRWLNTKEPGDSIVARGTVTAFDPPHLVEYDTDIHGRLRWELKAQGEGCLLIFTCTIALSPEQLLSHTAGWHIHLDHLAEALNGQPVDWPRWWTDHYPRWQAIHDRYAAASK